jgi:hypothetical protein
MSRRPLLILVLLAGLLVESVTPFSPAQQSSAGPSTSNANAARGLSNEEFGRLSKGLSESAGYFDTDNLISNEASYLHVMGRLKKIGVQGGAYIGVGPDQNFSYIAQIRPQIAYIVDIRRDNLLQHLLFKALFELSRNRIEYLCLLFGRPVPTDAKSWDTKTLQQMVEFIDRTSARKERFEATRGSIATRVRNFGISLSDADMATIGRIHEAFFEAGLDLRFTSKNRPPRSYYPTYRDLLLERDLSGKQASFIASEDDFQFLRNLEGANLVVPVVGNLAGEHALAAIANDTAVRGLKVSAFYTSNVEFYLMREGGFDRYAENVRRLPQSDQSVIIRSYFSGGFGYPHPQSVPGYYSTQLLQTMSSFVREYSSGGYDSYSDLVSKHSLELKP